MCVGVQAPRHPPDPNIGVVTTIAAEAIARRSPMLSGEKPRLAGTGNHEREKHAVGRASGR